MRKKVNNESQNINYCGKDLKFNVALKKSKHKPNDLPRLKNKDLEVYICIIKKGSLTFAESVDYSHFRSITFYREDVIEMPKDRNEIPHRVLYRDLI